MLKKILFDKNNLNPFLVQCIIYLVAFCALFFSNYSYLDDMSRAVEGYQGWQDYSRYSSMILSTLIHGGTFLGDISPLPQLIAVLELAIAGTIVVRVFSNKETTTIWGIIAVLPLGLCPFFLECMSFKFDAPYMALSILASIVPLCFTTNMKKYFLISFASLIVMNTSYQAASGIYPMFAITFGLYMWTNGSNAKECLRFICVSAIAYCAAMFCFYFLLYHPISSGYASSSLPAFDALFSTVLSNLKGYYKIVLTRFEPLWLFLICITILSSLIILTIKSKQNRFRTLIVLILSGAIIALLVFGLYPLLEKPLFAARAMVGVGAFLTIISIPIGLFPRFYITKIVSLCLAWVFLSFALLYGNALYSQAEWTDFRISNTINTLDEISSFSNESEKEIQIQGTTGYAPSIKKQVDNHPMLNMLIYTTYDQWTPWGYYGISTYYGLNHIKWIPYKKGGTDFSNLDLPLLKDTIYQSVYGDGVHFLIRLK